MSIAVVAMAFVAATVVSAVSSHAVVPLLVRRGFIDVPNERSSHSRVTPRGGGIAPVGVLLASGLVAGLAAGIDPLSVVVLGLAAILAAMSLFDDARPLPAGIRLGVHAGAVIVAVATMFASGALPLEPPVPALVQGAWIAFAWVWFVNLTNFMDGIDGISGVEMASIGLGGVAVLAVAEGLSGPGGELGLSAAVFAGAAAGFLAVNWHPARVFLGDVGSITLGFLAGGLLVLLAARGHVAAALILPAYYVVDATVTLLIRIRHRENLATAHRSHAYQRAVRGGLNHANVCLRLAGLNMALIMFAVASTAAVPWLCVAAAYGLAFALFFNLRRRA